MALTVGRWIAIAGLCCLALAVAYLPPQPSWGAIVFRAEEPLETARLNLLNNAYQRTENVLGAVRFRDSLSRAVRVGASGTRDVVVFVRGTLSDSAQRAFRTAVDRVWQRTHPAPGARLIVVLEIGTRRFYQARYVLPSALDGRTCAVALALDWSVEWLKNPPVIERGENLQPWLLEQLGPCLYYSAFGRPGPQIEDWLRARSYHLANVADWDGPPPTLRLLEEPNALDLVVSEMSFDALACADGRLPRCRSAISNDRYWQPTGLRLKAPEISGYLRRTYWPRNFLGEDRYLSTLVHDMGRARFARFWRSSAPVDSAFGLAFGESVDRWTMDWARSVVPELPPLGPAPRGHAVFLSLALAAFGLTLALSLIGRRHVT